jgi:hypothetical protein
MLDKLNLDDPKVHLIDYALSILDNVHRAISQNGVLSMILTIKKSGLKQIMRTSESVSLLLILTAITF